MDAIYARQSVEKIGSLSIAGQIKLCRAKSSGEPLVYQDQGFSGKNTNRPSFQQMMTDVERGLISKIIVYRIDRFSRSLVDFYNLWEILQKRGVEFVSASEDFDTTTPMGKAMLSIIMVFAQLERETTAERVRDNYHQRTNLGAWPGGPAPYGFDLGKLPCTNGKLMSALIANEQAKTVLRIFRDYADTDTSLGSVARRLNSDGISAPRRNVWDNVSLSRILHNPVYVMADEEVYLFYSAKGVNVTNPPAEFDGAHAGLLTGKRDRSANKYNASNALRFSLANHLGFVPADLWLQCQYKLDNNRQLGGKGKGKHTWLSGLLKCAACGYSVKVNKDGNKYYLVCSGRSNLGICDQSIHVDLRELEAATAEELERLLAQCSNTASDPVIADQNLAQAVNEIDQKIDRLVSALAEGNVTAMNYINRKLKELDRERQALLDGQSKKHSRKKHLPDRLVFHDLSFEEKKLVAAQFIREIRLSANEAEVIWTV